jgi:hypothetical protein
MLVFSNPLILAAIYKHRDPATAAFTLASLNRQINLRPFCCPILALLIPEQIDLAANSRAQLKVRVIPKAKNATNSTNLRGFLCCANFTILVRRILAYNTLPLWMGLGRPGI